MSEKDYYQILGVADGASHSEIRKAFVTRSQMFHPDRFDPKTQRDQWELANEMLKALNEAYQCLRDPGRRASYDSAKKRPSGGSTPPPEQAQAQQSGSSKARRPQEDTRRPKVRISKPTAGTISRSNLTQEQRDKIDADAISSESSTFCFPVYSRRISIGRSLLACIVLGVGYLFAVLASGERSEYLLFVSLLVIGSGGAWLLFEIAEGAIPAGNALTGSLLLSPVYLISISPRGVLIAWPLWDIKLLEPDPHTPGTMRSSKVGLRTNAGFWNVFMRAKDFQTLDTLLSKYQRQLAEAVKPLDGAFFLRWDYFQEAQLDEPSQPPSRSAAYVVTMLLVGGLFSTAVALSTFSETAKTKKTEPTSTDISHEIQEGQQFRSDQEESLSQYGLPRGQFIADSVPQPEVRRATPVIPRAQPVHPSPKATSTLLPPLPRPENGTLMKRSTSPAVAPFEIRTTAGHDYLVKLVDMRTGEDSVAVYVRGGQTTTTQVPLGIFELRYAVGDAWMGVSKLFGPETGYFRSDDPMQFTRSLQGYSGYTVTLYPVVSGNMETEPIPPDAF